MLENILMYIDYNTDLKETRVFVKHKLNSGCVLDGFLRDDDFRNSIIGAVIIITIVIRIVSVTILL